MFYNELDVLEARLQILDEYVDRFVLVEAEVTHVGTPKELFFEKNKERFAKWLPKITHVIAKDLPTDKDPWSREKAQRHALLEGLADADPHDIVMVSDVDEIPDLSKVPFENMPYIVLTVHMHMFEYSLDYYFDLEPWYGTIMTTVEMLKKYGPNEFRDNRWKYPTIHDAGWHLSSFGDPKHVRNKFETYAHALDATTAPGEVIEENAREGKWNGQKLQPPPDHVPMPPLPFGELMRLNLLRFPSIPHQQ
jgi:beta-1,4-mannosyl-glycoprotein beta-1,4-N-acetylglucosaminyltransferase